MDKSKTHRPLSPVSRRLFLRNAAAAVAAATAVTACGGGGGYGDYIDTVGYCDGCGANYNTVVGSYCDYFDYCDGCLC